MHDLVYLIPIIVKYIRVSGIC